MVGANSYLVRCYLRASSWFAIWSIVASITLCWGLETRQEVNPSCTDGPYTTPIGLRFDVRCDYNTPGHDIGTAHADNITDCMEQCSTMMPGDGFGPCQAVILNITSYTCFFKDGNITTQNLVSAPGRLSALADASQFTALEFACPSDLQTAPNGMTFKVDCNHKSPGDGFVWDDDPYYQPHHSDTFEECMEWCSNGSPLCYGVVWEADTMRGYRNCLPKNKNISTETVETNLNIHVAQVLLSVDLSPCHSDPYLATNGQSFHKTCGTTMDGPFIGQVHMANFDACIDYCATFVNGTERCAVAVYQPSAADGFENCHLRAAPASGYSNSLYNVAVLDQPNNVSVSNTTNPDDAHVSEEGDSKAWVAGAVIGPVIGIALVAGFFFWRRKRQHGQQVQNPSQPYTAVRPVEISAVRAPDPSEMEAVTNYRHRQDKHPQELP